MINYHCTRGRHMGIYSQMIDVFAPPQCRTDETTTKAAYVCDNADLTDLHTKLESAQPRSKPNERPTSKAQRIFPDHC